MNENDIIHTDPNDFDYPVGVTCGSCGHRYDIDPVTEENLRTIIDEGDYALSPEQEVRAGDRILLVGGSWLTAKGTGPVFHARDYIEVRRKSRMRRLVQTCPHCDPEHYDKQDAVWRKVTWRESFASLLCVQFLALVLALIGVICGLTALALYLSNR